MCVDIWVKSAKLHALCVLASTRFTPHWYMPYAPDPSLLCALCTFFLINGRLMHLCLVLLQITLCLSAPAQKKFNKVRNNHGHRQRCKFSVLDWRHPFWANLTQKCSYKLKFGFQANSYMQNSMVMFTFSIFNQNYPFWVNLVQKIKIVSLSWSLVPTLLRTWCNPWLKIKESKKSMQNSFLW